MLRVVLADDEIKLIYLLEHLIDWEQMGYEIVGVAHDGLQALDLVTELRPHLLVTDIQMPGCSGLDLIRQVKDRQPGIHCIIVSGYREFEYAQSALKYGVEDYLLKPLKKDELGSILMRLRGKLGEEEQTEQRQKRINEKKQDLLLERLRRCVRRNRSFCDLETANDEYGFSFVEKGVCFAAVIRPDIPEAGSHLESYRILVRHSLDIVRRHLDMLPGDFAAAVFPEGIAAVVNCPEYDALEIRQCFTRIRREIEQQRDLFRAIRACTFLGSRKTLMEEMTDSMREALWLCSDRICSLQTDRDAEAEKVDSGRHYEMGVGLKKRLQEAAEYLDEDQFEEAFRGSLIELRAGQPVTGPMVEEWYREVLRASLYGLERAGMTDTFFEEDMLERFWYCRNTDEVRSLLLTGLEDVMRRLREQKAQQESRPITEARRYIQQHYDQPLRLEDVSAYVGFNSTYFSTLFKKETGMNFTDYLGQIRVEKAKDLLVSDAYSVLDICEMVGYKDLKYFSRLFKKITGISPSDFRKLYR